MVAIAVSRVTESDRTVAHIARICLRINFGFTHFVGKLTHAMKDKSMRS